MAAWEDGGFRGEQPGHSHSHSRTAGTFFAGLSSSMQRCHVGNINAAKSADTRQRRIGKAVALFRDGRQR